MTANKWRELANYRPEFTDMESVFVDFAVRHIDVTESTTAW
jgi:hypothetical protein